MHEGTLRITETVNRRASMSVDVYSNNGSYIPVMEDTVEVKNAASQTIFKGFIKTPEVNYFRNNATMTTIVCEDFTAYADRRLVKAETTAAIVARDAVDLLVTNFLATYGVTRDAGMGTGATITDVLRYDYATVTEVLNDIVRIAAPTGWVWRIDENKVLKAFLPAIGTWACPFSITPTNTNVHGTDLVVRRSRDTYANRVYFSHKVAGSTTPAVVQANNAGEQSTYGLFEVATGTESEMTTAQAQQIADALLVRVLTRARTIEFRTKEQGARAGMTISVNLPIRGIASATDFLITDVEISTFGDTMFTRIKASEGGVIATSWQDIFENWGGTGPGKGSSGIQAVAGSIVTTTSTVGRSSYYLGGSGFAAEQSAGPSVINAVGYIDVMIDKSAIGASTSVTAVVQCRTKNAGISVTPQVYNVTTAAVAGTGSAVVGVTWTTVTFTITVASGQNTYRLRMTPGTANEDVFCHGYLEVGR